MFLQFNRTVSTLLICECESLVTVCMHIQLHSKNSHYSTLALAHIIIIPSNHVFFKLTFNIYLCCHGATCTHQGSMLYYQINEKTSWMSDHSVLLFSLRWTNGAWRLRCRHSQVSNSDVRKQPCACASTLAVVRAHAHAGRIHLQVYMCMESMHANLLATFTHAAAAVLKNIQFRIWTILSNSCFIKPLATIHFHIWSLLTPGRVHRSHGWVRRL